MTPRAWLDIDRNMACLMTSTTGGAAPNRIRDLIAIGTLTVYHPPMRPLPSRQGRTA